MVRPTALILFAAVALMGCGKDETCDLNCGILYAKEIRWSHANSLNPYRYTINMECTGEQKSYWGGSGTDYNQFHVGGEICAGDITRF